ncbi:MAG TPA: hypothetical protein VGJ09_18365 [Bryobacteraceae bacterium]
MSVLAEFFRGSETQLGIFAPRDYLVALFPDFAAAGKAERSLLEAGFAAEEVIAVPGEDVVRFVKENARNSGLATLLMQSLSRMFETEEVYADHDCKLAAQGAGFCAVHASSASRKKAAWELVEPLSPIVARYYSLGGVEHLKGET